MQDITSCLHLKGFYQLNKHVHSLNVTCLYLLNCTISKVMNSVKESRYLCELCF